MTSEDAIIIAEALTRALPEIAIQFEDILAIKTPVDKGHLRASVTVRVGSKGLEISMLWYGEIVEFGLPVKMTGPVPNFPNYGHRPNPFIRSTAHQQLPKIIVDEIQRELNNF